jgi:hypothetical protein
MPATQGDRLAPGALNPWQVQAEFAVFDHTP